MGIRVYTALYHNHMYFSRHFDPGDPLSGTANSWRSHVKIDFKKITDIPAFFFLLIKS